TGLNGLLNMVSGSDTALGQLLNANVWNTIFSSGFYMPSNTIAPFLGLLGQQAADTASGAGQAVGEAIGEAGGRPPPQGGGEGRRPAGDGHPPSARCGCRPAGPRPHRGPARWPPRWEAPR